MTARSPRWPVGLLSTTRATSYIADTFNNRVRKVDVHGVITTVAGNGDAKSWQFGDERARRPGSSRSLFGIVHTAVERVTGRDDRETDGGLAIDAQITCPYAIGVDSAGNLYVLNV